MPWRHNQYGKTTINRHAMTHRELIDSKVVTVEKLTAIISERKSIHPHLKIVFTNGCFDLVHRGHVHYLSKSRDLGDMLIVGINSDDSVRRLKGPQRPIASQANRATVLAAFECVDYVVVFDEDTPINLITSLCPDVLVKGKDYAKKDIVGASFVESHGGRVETIELIEGESTTNFVNKMQNAKQ